MLSSIEHGPGPATNPGNRHAWEGLRRYEENLRRIRNDVVLHTGLTQGPPLELTVYWGDLNGRAWHTAPQILHIAPASPREAIGFPRPTQGITGLDGFVQHRHPHHAPLVNGHHDSVQNRHPHHASVVNGHHDSIQNGHQHHAPLGHEHLGSGQNRHAPVPSGQPAPNGHSSTGQSASQASGNAGSRLLPNGRFHRNGRTHRR